MAFAGTERFELRRPLGRGGMGVVHEAYDRIRGMRVALKTLRRLDADGLLRFKHEFRALSTLSHPNIISLYELVSEGEDWFFTMEFVDGQDLVSYVRGNEPAHGADLGGAATLAQSISSAMHVDPAGHTTPASGLDTSLDVTIASTPAPATSPATSPAQDPAGSVRDLDELVESARLWDALGQLARALCALHEAGLVHRDVKPSNVMVARDGRVVLMDFGVVAATRGEHELGSLVDAGGTPAFMAPEQARGEASGPAADWYAFGVTLYLLLTGRMPLGSDGLRVLLDKQERDPPPPSTYARGIPSALERLCVRLLARDPGARPTGSQVLAALGLAAAPSRRTRSTPVDTDVFVGRDHELAALHRNYRIAAAGAMRCVVVTGLSGMGKTSLIVRLLGELRAGPDAPLVLMGRCRERESLAYNGFDGIFDQLSTRLQHMPAARRQDILPEGASLLARLFPVLRRVPELDTGAHVAGSMELRRQAVHLLRALIAALAVEQPIVAWIDDLQWADQDSLDLLRGLIEPPAPARLLVVATVRAEALEQTETFEQLLTALDAHPDCLRIALGPLSLAEQSALVQTLGERSGLHAPIAEELVHGASGHPMLLAELVRFAEDAPEELGAMGALRLEDVIWQRVTRLPVSARALVEAIAVAGEPTPLWVLAATAALPPDAQEQALAVASAQCLVRVARAGAEPWLDTYHDKVREAVAEHLPAERQAALHGRLARAMERQGEASPALLARHWLAVGEREKAVEHLLHAAEIAAEQLAFEHEATLYRTAAEVLDDMPRDPVHDRQRCTVWLGLARSMRLAERIEPALPLVDAAEAVATAHGWREELADLHSLRGNLLFTRGDLAGCLEHHTRARDLARDIDSRREAAALGGLGDAYYMHGRISTAFTHYDQCVRLSRQHGFEDIEAANLGVRGFMRYYQNDFETSLRDGTQAVALARRIAHPRAEIVATILPLGRAWTELGWLDRARPALERARALARTLGSRRFELLTMMVLARLLRTRRHDAEADELVRDTVAMLRDPRRTYLEAAVLSLVALVTRDRATREWALAEAESAVKGRTQGAVVLLYRRDAMDLALDSGDYAEMERHARVMEHLTHDEPLPWCRFTIERARALAAFYQGRRDAAMPATLQRLFREACQVGFHVAAEALGDALASFPEP